LYYSQRFSVGVSRRLYDMYRTNISIPWDLKVIYFLLVLVDRKSSLFWLRALLLLLLLLLLSYTKSIPDTFPDFWDGILMGSSVNFEKQSNGTPVDSSLCT